MSQSPYLSKMLVIPEEGAIQVWPADSRVMITVYNKKNRAVARFSLTIGEADTLAENVKRVTSYNRAEAIAPRSELDLEIQWNTSQSEGASDSNKGS